MGLCADTCHLFAAGYELDTEPGVRRCFAELRHARLTRRLGLVHANDSKDACGSTRDRHENLGAGTIGEAAFAELVRHPAVREVPLIVETPSPPDSSGHAADVAFLNALPA